LTYNEAIESRNSIAKRTYKLLFDYLIKIINQTISEKMHAERDVETTSIGVLDIFGFEIFKENSFEQLCINFANEKL